MEEQLSSKKLASASVRKQRSNRRQKHKDLMAEQREEWRKRRQRYSEIYKTDSDQSRSNSPENDSSGESPSEDNVRTPGSSISPDVEFNISISDLTLERFARRSMDTDIVIMDKPTGTQDWNIMKTTSASTPRLNAVAAHPNPYRSNRFSTMIDSIDIPPDDGVMSSGRESDSEEDDESDDEYSPIEIATPIAFCVPTTKPNVISLVELRPQRSSATNPIDMSGTPSPRTSISTYDSQQTSKSHLHSSSGILAFEAEPLEVFAPIQPSVISVTSSSEDVSSSPDNGKSNSIMRRKSSVPMLSKFTHARMNSIKKLIAPQSISEPLPVVPKIPLNHQSQLSENIRSLSVPPSMPSPIYLNKDSGEYERFDRLPWRTNTDPLTQNKRSSTIGRPQTSHQPYDGTLRKSNEMINTSSVSVIIQDEDVPSIRRKKSFSNLRRRSGSLGQALKLSSDKSRSPILDSNPPPVPTINTDNYNVFGFGMTPKTPKSLRASGLLLRSPFPSSSHNHNSHGLGLRV